MNTQQIHSDINGVTTSAVLDLQDGTDVEGHEYEIVSGPITQRISFQLGPVKEVGVNGLTSEALLAVLIHRTQRMDRQFSCHHIGPYEDARDYIDDTWWTHWETITGARGERGSYFSCSC